MISVITIDRKEYPALSTESLDSGTYAIGTFAYYNEKWYPNGFTSWMHDSDVNCDSVFFIEDKDTDSCSFAKNERILYFLNESELEEWLFSHFKKSSIINDKKYLNEKKYLVAFVNDDDNITIIPELAKSICDKRNPYYDKKIAEKEGLNILVNSDFVPSELMHYLVKYNLMPDARLNAVKDLKASRKIVKENADFFARYFRRENY